MSAPFRAFTLAALLLTGGVATAPAQTAGPATPAAPAPAAPPAAETPPPPPPPAPRALFGEEATLTAKPIIYIKGTSNWDQAYESIVDAFKSLYAYLDKNGVKRAGPPMTIYTQADDVGFSFHAAVPIEGTPKEPPTGDIASGQSPAGKTFKFVHTGSYDSMDSTYEAITNFLDEKRAEAQDLFVEEYQTDPVTTPDDKLVVHVYVPIK